jgi:hypothetical protein
MICFLVVKETDAAGRLSAGAAAAAEKPGARF